MISGLIDGGEAFDMVTGTVVASVKSGTEVASILDVEEISWLTVELCCLSEDIEGVKLLSVLAGNVTVVGDSLPPVVAKDMSLIVVSGTEVEVIGKSDAVGWLLSNVEADSVTGLVSNSAILVMAVSVSSGSSLV